MTLRRALRNTVANVTRFAADAPGGLRILTYHRVNDDHPADRLSVPRVRFEEQMAELAASKRPVVRLEDALVALRGQSRLPERAVALTFDDGYQDNFRVALPVLTRHGFPATFFIATGLIGGTRPMERYRSCCDSDRMLDWAEVAQLGSFGHGIGGHTREHRELATLSAAERAGEIAGCRQDIAEKTGTAPSLFCYPRGSEGPDVRRDVAAAGFEGACTVAPGANAPGVDLFGLRRTEVSAQDTIEDFRVKLDGGFDGWHRIVQQVRALGAR